MDLIIQGLTKQFQTDRGLTSLRDDEAFEAFAGFCVLSSFYEDEFDPDRFRTGGGNDFGIDTYAIVVNGDLLRDPAEVRDAVEQARQLDVRFVIVQAKTTAGFEAKVFTDLADNLIHLFTAGSIAYPASEDVLNLRSCIDAIYSDVGKLSRGLPRLSVRYVSTGTVGNDLLDQKRSSAATALDATNRFEDVDILPVGARELRELYKRATEAVSASFTLAKRITLPRIPGVEQAFLGVLPARELVSRLLTDSTGGIRKTLFYENVRDFQDYNAVNQEIRATLQDGDRRDRFAVLNNGITIVTRELTTAGDDFRIRDFQIVNGCQTCHVLFDEREALTDGVYVNIRLVESRDEDVIGGIIAATNRQTAVSDEDLAAREQFQKDLEEFFTAQPERKRLFYERRSRQYSAHQQVEKTRIITRGQLIRAYAAMFLDEPARIGHYTELKQARGAELFQPNHAPIVYYAAASTYYRLEWLFRNGKLPRVYAPTRYHLLAAVKTYLLGAGRLDPRPRKAAEECRRVLEVVWNPLRAEDLVNRLLAVIQAAAQEEAQGAPLGELVRTQRFADRVRKEVLALPRT
ncbi:AIPR family protein [Phytohabitans sp. LJ34]|uniref:AIPR family protein n=1 Tax=Phytohabitans sp. LJ34 TaxID=3452217 RepID=UPI003F88F9BA